ncbi:MAG: carbohydrate ABC transporter permease [Eubacteriales bacterium]|nr:carbohydrate ABC transporter permease [Eubacteriales bacterium]
MQISKRKRISRSKTGDMINFLYLCFFGAFMVLPFVYTIVQSIKPLEELFIYPPRFFWVNRPTIDNYLMLSHLTSNLWVPFGRYLVNSIIVTISGTLLHVFAASMAAYVLAKNIFPGRKLFSELIIWALLFTGPVTAVPQYVLMASAGMINTFYAMILPAISTPLGLFLIQQNMLTIPNSIIESAKIDGAGTFRIYSRIAVPIVKPAILTATIFSFQALWNGANSSFVYEESLKVLPTILSQIATSGIARAGVGAAVSVLLLIPPVLVFLMMQSNVMETMAQSGIK